MVSQFTLSMPKGTILRQALRGSGEPQDERNRYFQGNLPCPDKSGYPEGMKITAGVRVLLGKDATCCVSTGLGPSTIAIF